MKLKYGSEKVKLQCTSHKAAKKLFGGNDALAVSLLSRINAIEEAKTIKDIIVQPQFKFHKLNGREYEGYFAIDVKSRKDAWRILLRPLNQYMEPYIPCNIDEIAELVEIVEIKEVSHHYE